MRSPGGWDAGLLGLRACPYLSAGGRAFRLPQQRRRYVCALRADGSAACWGEAPSGRLTPPEGERFATIDIGRGYACGIREDGSPLCWFPDDVEIEGEPPPYDLGAWAPWEIDAASDSEEGRRFLAISGSFGYACALREDGSPACWNFAGVQLPPFGQTSRPEDERFVAISAAPLHTCALREDGSPVCWGATLPHYDGGQAAPPGGDRLQPALPADERFTAISNAGEYVCALREDGAPVCAGRGSYSYYAPPEGETLTAISVGDFQACGLREDGSPVCWPDDDPYSGWREFGLRLSQPPQGEKFTAISVGVTLICGLREDGSPRCWSAFDITEGSEAAAQGWDQVTELFTPEGERFAAISVGAQEACGLRRDGSPVCWPAYAFEDDVGSETSTAPPADERLAALSVGLAHACALREDGSAVCWGETRHGQASPPEGAAFTSISGGRFFTCGVRKDGSLVCWGSVPLSSDPRVPGVEAWPPGADERFIAVSAGDQRMCAIRTDGGAACWGGGAPS